MLVNRIKKKILADPKKVILQYLQLNNQRTERVIANVVDLSEMDANNILTKLVKDFSGRHRNFEEKIYLNYLRVKDQTGLSKKLSDSKKLLIGAYFSKEYSISAAALFNPSIVMHPDQSNLKKDEIRFLMSLRATGEGHISSIEFREGIIGSNYRVSLSNSSRFCSTYKNLKFSSKSEVKNKFKTTRLEEAVIKDYSGSNYSCSFDHNVPVNERVLFPVSASECVGMEDLRLVKFGGNNNPIYYGTYTAYNGFNFRTQLLETRDFLKFKIHTLHGDAVKDKGMALFPRKINGKYVITSRQDGENLFIMNSENLFQWYTAEKLKTPEYSWEFLQIGNCGSPIETEKGWILITHAVGPMRRYVISAVLLDLQNPAKIIGVLDNPLIEPNQREREGYVPNVVYSCGSMVYKNNLVIPYAYSDSASGFAMVNVNELLKRFINVN